LTVLLHRVGVDRLRAAYLALRPRAAPAVDGVTWHEYAQDLEDNPRDLHARVHRGSCGAKPSRRTYLPKPDGRQRPLGIAALEDKILQRAVVEVLNAIYEQDVLGFSYGGAPRVTRWTRSRPGPCKAGELGARPGSRDSFSRLDPRWLGRFVEHRIADPRILRLIRSGWPRGSSSKGRGRRLRRAFRKGPRFLRFWRTFTPLPLRPVGPPVANAARAR
jgi:RNA-directed DNA polymerase